MAGRGSPSKTVGEQLAILTERIEAQGASFAEVKVQLVGISEQIKEGDKDHQEFRLQYTKDFGAQNARIGSIETGLSQHTEELKKHVEDDKPKWALVTALQVRVNKISNVIGPLQWASVILGSAVILWGFDRVVELFSK